MRNLRTWEEEVAETRMLVNFIKTKIRLSNEATIKNRALKFIVLGSLMQVTLTEQ